MSGADRTLRLAKRYVVTSEDDIAGLPISHLAAVLSDLAAAVVACDTGAGLRKALKPFVRHWEPWMDATDINGNGVYNHPDDAEMSCFARVTFGDLRRARAALATDATARVVDSPLNTSGVVVSEKGFGCTQTTDATDGAKVASEAAGLRMMRLVERMHSRETDSGGVLDIVSLFQEADAIHAALTHPAPSGASGEVDYAEAARVMFEACRDRFMRS